MSAWNDLLKPYAKVYAAAEQRIASMDGDDLHVLEAACRSASETNCWYAEYRVAQILLPLITREYERREYLRKMRKTSSA